MTYQFCMDGRPAAAPRATWREAAQDAVAAGMAVWTDADAVKLDDCQGAEILRTGAPS